MDRKYILISLSNNYNYLAMGYVYLLNAVGLLTPWNQTGHHHPHCLLHTKLILITAIIANPVLQRYDIIKRSVVHPNVETVNYLELVA